MKLKALVLYVQLSFSTRMCIVREYKCFYSMKSNNEIPSCVWYHQSWEKSYFLWKYEEVQHPQFPPLNLRGDMICSACFWAAQVIGRLAQHLSHLPSRPRVAEGHPTQKGLGMSWLNKVFTLPCQGSSKGLRLLTEPLEKGSPSCMAFQSRSSTVVSYFLGLCIFPHQPHKPQMEFKDLLIPHHNLVSPLPLHLPFASCLRQQHPEAGQGLSGPGRGGCHV